MSAITKERIELFIKNPLENGLTRGEQMELARIALASLESVAEPVVPDEMTPKQASRSYCGEVRGYRDGWNACRARIIGNMLLSDMDIAAASKMQELTTDNTAQQFESLSRGDK